MGQIDVTGDKLRLQIRLGRQELTEWAKLANRCSVTRQMLGAQAIRQLAASLRGPAAPLRPLLDPAEQTILGAGEAIFLGADDAGELAAIAAKYDATPERVAVTAVRYMLKDARAGIVPLVRPLQPGVVASEPVWYNIENAADNNYNKALRILDVLTSMMDKGLTAENRAALAELEAKETTKPLPRRTRY